MTTTLERPVCGRVGICALLCLSSLQGAALAQTPGTGAIAGAVLGPTGQPVANAHITVTNTSTHASRRLASSSEGTYKATLLSPGTYSVQISQEGFSQQTSEGVQVSASHTSDLTTRLAIAGPNTSVRVEARGAVTDLDNSTLGGLVEHETINALPLATRNYTQLLGLQPGVFADAPTATVVGNGSQNVSSQGATPTANNIQFNGIDANNLLENSAATAQNYESGVVVPAPDAIEQFRMQTANYDAGYGRGSGANVDLIGRAGANTFHGSLWEFLRNDLFNANHFFAKLANQPRAEDKQNQFGGSIGGPLMRDRAFFFFAYQGTRQANALAAARTATLPLFTNDRSASSLGAQFCPATHLNAGGGQASGYTTKAGGAQVLCDGSNINPVALAVLNAKFANGQFVVPSPQTQLVVSGPTASDQLPLGISTFQPPTYSNEDQYTANLDEVLGKRNTLTERFFRSNTSFRSPFSPNGANVPGWGTNAENRNTVFVVSDTQAIGARLVNIARAGYTRFDGIAAAQNPLTAASLGVGTPTGPATATANMPAISVGGFTIGDGGTPEEWSVTSTVTLQDTVAYTRGRSDLRFGAEYKHHAISEDQPQQTDGFLMIASLPDFLLGQSAAQNGSPLGQSNVSLSIAGGGIFRRDERYNDVATFVQEDFKVTPRLLIQAGLRYEIFAAPTETNGRLTNFDPSLALRGVLPQNGTLKGFTVASNFRGAVPQGVTQTPYAGFYRTPHGDVSPRLGFVWQAPGASQLVVRGGFGIYYDRHSGNLPEQMLGQAPFAVSQFNSGPPNGPATLQNPFVPNTPPLSAFPAFQPLVNFGFPFLEGINPNIRDGQTLEYNVNIERALGRDTVAQVGYVGTQSRNRSGQIEFDQALLASPQAPVNGLTTNTSDNAFLRMPYQGVSPGSLFSDSVFEASFNALEASLTRRFSRGLEFGLSYTWSKNLDEVNGEGGLDTYELQLPTNNNFDLRHSSYGLANDDRSNRFVGHFLWNTPSVKGSNVLVRSIVNHWRVSGILLVQSGNPFSIFDNNAGSVYSLLGGQVRGQILPSHNPSTSGSLFDRVVKTRYLDATAFTRAPQAPNSESVADQDFGNSGVGIVRGPGQHNLDFALERSFPFRDHVSLSLRGEAFNLTNTPQFANPNNNLGYGNALADPIASSGFGLILSEQGGPHPRVIQIAAHLTF